MGSSLGCRWISAPLWTPMVCRGTACLTMVCSTGCRGISVLAPGAPPPPPSALTLASAELHASHSLTPFILLHFFSPSQICYPRGATTIADGLRLGQWRVCHGVGWHWLHQTQGQLPAASHRSHPCSLPATKTLPCKPDAVRFWRLHRRHSSVKEKWPLKLTALIPSSLTITTYNCFN